MKILTKTENKVAHLIANGKLYKEIADDLHVSAHTIHTHLKNIRLKTGAKNIADVTRMYILSLENPKLVLKAVFFLLLQLGIIWFSYDYDRTRLSNKNRVSKVSRTRTRVDYA